MAKTTTKAPAGRKPTAKTRTAARTAAPKRKAAPKKAAAKPAGTAARLSATDRINILEMQVQDLQGIVANLRHVLASALRQTPHLYPLYSKYLEGFGEDGGGGK